ncbi:acetate/propionate family kinase [Neomoorella thermoacetica]|uniref:acetate/propionate family kinase n=1 Tax=Neomoorella thermoacetica TaxID=1525 RepID=UPI0008FB2368|nr:acetate kinase [Moorella thermoacetica]APC08062.1 acetate kinase [Moorella thermoacetica]
MKILVLNCGSSSVKYQLFDMEDESVLAKGLVERIGIDGSVLTHRPAGKEKLVRETEIPDHKVAIRLCLEALTDPHYGVIKDYSEIGAIGHRIVHGGTFPHSVLVDASTKKAISELEVLAPLHNGPALRGIEACEAILPGTPQVTAFDTAFHQGMPDYAYTYSLPYELCQKHLIRRYGAHGTSHQYVALRAAAIVGKPLEELKVITCHLGNGSSITAIKNAKSYDTSMGFTPLAGLTMGTRCGDIDPAIVPFLIEKEGYTPAEMDQVMNRRSGVLGVSGLSSDFRDIEAAMAEGNDRARLAWEVFVHSAKKYIGAYAALLNGLDILVFTAGLGENSIAAREAICRDMDYLGIKIDPEKNQVRGQEREITAAGARVRTFVIPTNEELMIARDTLALVQA